MLSGFNVSELSHVQGTDFLFFYSSVLLKAVVKSRVLNWHIFMYSTVCFHENVVCGCSVHLVRDALVFVVCYWGCKLCAAVFSLLVEYF